MGAGTAAVHLAKKVGSKEVRKISTVGRKQTLKLSRTGRVQRLKEKKMGIRSKVQLRITGKMQAGKEIGMGNFKAKQAIAAENHALSHMNSIRNTHILAMTSVAKSGSIKIGNYAKDTITQLDAMVNEFLKNK